MSFLPFHQLRRCKLTFCVHLSNRFHRRIFPPKRINLTYQAKCSNDEVCRYSVFSFQLSANLVLVQTRFKRLQSVILPYADVKQA